MEEIRRGLLWEAEDLISSVERGGLMGLFDRWPLRIRGIKLVSRVRLVNSFRRRWKTAISAAANH
jgi:hypothetical protein